MSVRQSKSTSAISNFTTHVESITCIVKQGDGRPIRLLSGRCNAQSVEIAPLKGGEEKPLWMPRTIVFRDDADTFNALEAAFLAGESEQLEKLWEAAERWQPKEGTDRA